MTNVRDNFLEKCRDTHCRVVMFVTNGFQIKGEILSFDGEVIVFKREDGREAMVYQSAISTVLVEDWFTGKS